MKFSPVALVALPPLWSWGSGLFLLPLTTALGSTNPVLSASAWQAVVFVTSATLAGWVLGKAAESNREDLTRRDWQKVRENMVKEEKETAAKQYALTIAADSPWYREVNGQVDISKHPRGGHPYLALPRGVARWQVEAFYDLVVKDGKDATEENLAGGEKPFSQVSLRRWMVWLELNRWAIPARKGNNAKRILTPRGKRLVGYVYWRLQSQPDKAGQWIQDNHSKRRYSPPPLNDMRQKQALQSSKALSSE